MLGAYNKAENVWGDLLIDENKGEKKKPHGNRTVDKEKLEVSKECAECGKRIKNAKKALMCRCKVILFCTHSCLGSSDHFTGCGERDPPVKIDVDQMLRAGAAIKDGPNKTLKRTKSKLSVLDDVHPDKILEMAKDGHPVAAWMVGCSYSLRTTVGEEGRGGAALGFMMPVRDLKKSVGETDEAIRWFLVAAKGGMSEGMQSLAAKLWADNGLKVDTRVAFYWMAKAWETGETEDDVWDKLEEKGTLAGEIKAMLWALENSKVIRNQVLPISGPTLASFLLAAKHEELRTWATRKEPDHKCKTPTGAPLYGVSWMRKLFNLCDFRTRQIKPHFIAGRSGTGGAATKQVLGKERDINNIRFRQGEKDPLCLLDLELVSTFESNPDKWAPYQSIYLVDCIHASRKPSGECKICQEDAKERLRAVAEGSYSLSLSETIPGYAYGARYTNKQGGIVQEIYKDYSKPEISCVLQCLKTNHSKTCADLHPIFIAQDQNLFWPLIWYFGSLYTVILESCGENIIKELFGKTTMSGDMQTSLHPDTMQAFPESAVGEMRIACGSEPCPKLDHEKKFLLCTGCRVRRYCSKECRREDWGKHKQECKKMPAKTPEVD